MKKTLLIALTVFAACSVLAGTVSAAKDGYGFQIANGELITTDGAVDPAAEWTDSYKDFLYKGWDMTTNFFRCKWQGAPVEAWLIEIPTDTTDDPGDNYKMCSDNDVSGGTAPQGDDTLIDWTGGTTTIYLGPGTHAGGWGESSLVPGTDVIVATTMGTSPEVATSHRIIEIWIDKSALGMGFSNNMYMEYTDASTGETFKWPPESSPIIPDSWGTGTTEFGDPIPEVLTVGVMLSLSTVAVIVSTRYFRKRRI